MGRAKGMKMLVMHESVPLIKKQLWENKQKERKEGDKNVFYGQMMKIALKKNTLAISIKLFWWENYGEKLQNDEAKRP